MLSTKQLTLAEERVQVANLEDRIDVKLLDYRELLTPEFLL